MEFIKGDIHEVIKTFDDNSVDFIYTDPPFGTTQASWDKPLLWEDLFPEMWRVLKPTGTICLYASIPFTYELLQYEKPKYHYSWKKSNSTGFMGAKYQPLRCMEEIFIYYKKRGTYNPQMIGDEFYPKRNVQIGSQKQQYWGVRKDKNEIVKAEGHTGKYPTTFKDWKIRKKGTGGGITRDDDQIDFFIKTYTNEDDTVLDMTHHNELVGLRCQFLKRNYIGVDITPEFIF
tara:strand:- start:70 stop:762 length:693 start_codon:yes stop_codon:yes gene_type:complete